MVLLVVAVRGTVILRGNETEGGHLSISRELVTSIAEANPEVSNYASFSGMDFSSACQDFNFISASLKTEGRLEREVYTCPITPITKTICNGNIFDNSAYRERSEQYQRQPLEHSHTALGDIAFYTYVGYGVTAHMDEASAFRFTLDLMSMMVSKLGNLNSAHRFTSRSRRSARHLRGDARSAVDIVIIGDPCTDDPTAENRDNVILGLYPGVCSDSIFEFWRDISTLYPLLKIHLTRVGSNGIGTDQHMTYKAAIGLRQVFAQFPSKHYYFKFDLDTVLIPRRFLQFLFAIDESLPSNEIPIYFGTVLDGQWIHCYWGDGGSQVCSAQGRVGLCTFFYPCFSPHPFLLLSVRSLVVVLFDFFTFYDDGHCDGNVDRWGGVWLQQ
jgi:hypothetical protein